MILTEEQIAEIRARAEAATPGPWRHLERDGRQNQRIEMRDDREVTGPDGNLSLVSCWATAWKPGGHKSSVANARFIAHARTDIPALLSALEAQAAELAEVRQQYVDANEARIDAEAQLAEARKTLGLMLREHDILSGNFGDVMDPKHKRPDRWPTAAEAARSALEGGKAYG